MRKKRSMWVMMQTKSKEFPVQEERIKKKKELLKKHGVDVDISHIKRPDSPRSKDRKKKKKSMWKMMQSMEMNFEAQQEYLDTIEEMYDKAILDILGPEYLYP